ncbi:MAG: hypothetical protein WB795_19050, partial [Candidatus Acidiferrales bacterium]
MRSNKMTWILAWILTTLGVLAAAGWQASSAAPQTAPAPSAAQNPAPAPEQQPSLPPNTPVIKAESR